MEGPLGRPREIATATTSIPAKNLTTPADLRPPSPPRRVHGGQLVEQRYGISPCRPLGHTTRRWGLPEPRQKAVPRWHHGSLVQVGHRFASLTLDLGAAPFFFEVIPLAPLVAVWTPAIVLTGVLSGLALRDLVAVPGRSAIAIVRAKCPIWTKRALDASKWPIAQIDALRAPKQAACASRRATITICLVWWDGRRSSITRNDVDRRQSHTMTSIAPNDVDRTQ